MGEGRSDEWTLSAKPLDEPAWMEVDLSQGADHLRFFRRVVQPDPEDPLVLDRMRAALDVAALVAPGATVEAALTFGDDPCGSTAAHFPFHAEGPWALRFRYVDVATNPSAWSAPYPLEGDGTTAP